MNDTQQRVLTSLKKRAHKLGGTVFTLDENDA